MKSFEINLNGKLFSRWVVDMVASSSNAIHSQPLQWTKQHKNYNTNIFEMNRSEDDYSPTAPQKIHVERKIQLFFSAATRNKQE